MKYKILLLVLFLFAIPVYAQIYSTTELIFTPSVRTLGMGSCGVSLVDEKSAYYNPASVGLFARENLVSINSFPGNKHYFYEFKQYSGSIVVPLQKYIGESGMIYAIGLSFNRISYPPFEETTVLYPEGTGRILEINLKQYHLTFSGAYLSNVHLSFGGTITYYNEKLYADKSSGIAFSAGLLAQLPMYKKEKVLSTYFNPAIGYAKRFIGWDKKIESYSYWTFPSYQYKQKLPDLTNLGMTLEIGIVDTTHPAKEIYSFFPTVDLIKEPKRDVYTQFGFEGRIYKAFSLRFGVINVPYGENITSKGFSFESKYFFWMLKPSLSKATSGFGKLFGRNLSLKYTYAKTSEEFSFHDIAVQIPL